MPPHRAAHTKIVTTDTSSTSLVVGGANGASVTGTGGIYAGYAALSTAAAPLIAPLTLRGGGAPGAYTTVNSAIILKNAAGTEQWRLYGTGADGSANYMNLYIGGEAGLSQPTDNVTAGYGNIGIGYQALKDISTGSWNVVLGVSTAENITTGTYNIAIGASAMAFGTTLDNCVAVGSNALVDCISGTSNTAVGSDALANATGNNNTAMGKSALINHVVGNENTALGSFALAGITTTTADVTAVGYQAGRLITAATPNTQSTQCVYLGANTRSSAVNQTNEIVIGYNADGRGSNTATLGNTSVTQAYLPLAIFQGTRAVAMGEWANQTFSAGEYTSDTGTWTVASGDVTTNRFSIVGKTVTWQLVLANTSVATTPLQLRVAIPGSLTAAAVVRGGACGATTANGAATEPGYWTLGSSGAFIAFRRSNGAVWDDGTDNTSISAVIVFEIA